MLMSISLPESSTPVVLPPTLLGAPEFPPLPIEKLGLDPSFFLTSKGLKG